MGHARETHEERGVECPPEGPTKIAFWECRSPTGLEAPEGISVCIRRENCQSKKTRDHLYTCSRGWTRQWSSFVTSLNGIIEVQILEVTSMGLCGCNLKEQMEHSNSTHKGAIWHQICISRSGDRQKSCWIVEMKIRGKILCSKITWGHPLLMERIPSRPRRDWWNETLSTEGHEYETLSL